MATITLLSETRARLDASTPVLKAVDLVISYEVPNAFFNPLVRQFKASNGRAGWDGRNHLLLKPVNTFPIGLVREVYGEIRNLGVKCSFVDERDSVPLRREPRGCRKSTLPGIELRDYQIEAADALVSGVHGILWAGTGSGKTEVAAAAIRLLLDAGLEGKVLFVTGRKALTRQSQKRLSRRLGQDVGIIGSGKWVEGPKVIAATINSLGTSKNRRRWRRLKRQVNVLVVDEAHHAAAKNWIRILRHIPARFRWGLSGTPLDRADGRNLHTIGTLGPVVYEIRAAKLVKRGVLARPEVHFLPMPYPDLPGDTSWEEVYKLGVVRNPYLHRSVVKEVEEAYKAGRRVLVFVQEIEHGDILDKMLWTYAAFIPHQFVSARDDMDTIQTALDELESGSQPVLISSPIFREGVDIPSLDEVVVADGGKSVIKVLQQVGRGLRRKKGTNMVKIVDFAFTGHHYLAEHSQKRLATYQREGFDIV